MVTVDDITITKATVTWIGNDLAYSYRIRKRPVGTETWVYSSVTAPTTTKTLSNNTPYTDYEVQVQAYCDSLKTDSSGYTTSVFLLLWRHVPYLNLLLCQILRTARQQ